MGDLLNEPKMATFLEEKINWVVDGYKDIDDYRKKVSSCNYIKGI